MSFYTKENCCPPCHCCNCCCNCPQGIKGPPGPQGIQGPPGPQGPQGEPAPFRSSYFEALGTTQTVEDNANFEFILIDNVGNNFVLSPDGKVITINQTGLYHIEWTANLAEDNTQTAHIGLLQNGQTFSYTASSAVVGNVSSGALINVTTVPFTISLNNKSLGALSIEDLVDQFSALSIRISRFADAPTS